MKPLNETILLSKVTFEYKLNEADAKSIKELLLSLNFFYDYEVEVAFEIIDDYLKEKKHSEYKFVLAKYDNRVIGFTCYGKISWTRDSYDLYWIAVSNEMRGKGVGLLLLKETEIQIQKMGGKKVYIETSSQKKYQPAQHFYLKAGYILEARVKDFYSDNDDKLIFSKKLK